MKEAKDIEFFDLSDEDLKQFNYYKKLSFFTNLFFGVIWIVLAFIAIVNADFNNIKDRFYIFLISIFSFIFIWNYIKYFLGKPVGIRYGYISKLVPHHTGRYREYKYNIHFRDINKSIYKKKVHISKNHNTIKLKDKVGVVKTKLGFYFIFPL